MIFYLILFETRIQNEQFIDFINGQEKLTKAVGLTLKFKILL